MLRIIKSVILMMILTIGLNAIQLSCENSSHELEISPPYVTLDGIKHRAVGNINDLYFIDNNGISVVLILDNEIHLFHKDDVRDEYYIVDVCKVNNI